MYLLIGLPPYIEGELLAQLCDGGQGDWVAPPKHVHGQGQEGQALSNISKILFLMWVFSEKNFNSWSITTEAVQLEVSGYVAVCFILVSLSKNLKVGTEMS